MTREIVLRPRAVADLSDIWDYTVATWSEDQAEAYLRALNKAFEVIADFPEIARLRSDFTPPVRLHPFRKHLIIYSADADKIDVIRVVHSRANWAEFLAE